MTNEAIDPLIRALFAKLPEADSVWRGADRDAWLDAARAIFDLLYKEPPYDTESRQ